MIDWDTHCARIIALLTRRGWPRLPRSISLRIRLDNEAAAIPIVARMLASRHIPNEVRRRYPGVRWAAVAHLGAYIERVRRGAWPRRLDGALIRDFNRRVAPAIIREVNRMRKDLRGSDVDGNLRDGILGEDYRRAFAHVTVRIPAHRVSDLKQFLVRAYADEPVPTVASIRAALRKAGPKLRAFGIIRVDLFGSVARGEASAASDIDLVYWRRGSLTLERWREINTLLENALGKVVDAHPARGPNDAPPGALPVWAAPAGATGTPKRRR